MTSSLLAARRGSQTPRVANYPPYALSGAPEFVDLARTTGLHPDPWQDFVLTHGLGMTPQGRWTASKVGCWCPRQNGKGGGIEVLELGWLFLTEEELIVHSAHQHRTAQKAYDRLEKLIRRTPDLLRRVKQFRQANGEQQIELHDGRLLQYTTRSRTAVRGFSAGKLILDEAQELTAEQMAAILPTVSAIDNHQVWFFGTPPDDPAAWVYGLKQDGESAVPRLAWFDWGLGTIPDDAAERAALAADVEARYLANPAAGIRITEETMADEARPSGLGVDKFLQERLGMWWPKATGGSGVIPAEVWQAQICAKERPTDVALCVQVNYRRTHTAIMAVGRRADGSLMTTIVDYRPGTHWVVDRAVQLKADWNPLGIAVQDKGPTGSLLEDMATAGLKPAENRDEPKRGDLAIPWADDVADAYGMWVDAVIQRRLWHRDEAPLNVALETTDTRPLSGGTAWDYKSETAAPLLGSTLALWLYVTWLDKVTDEYDALNNIW